MSLIFHPTKQIQERRIISLVDIKMTGSPKHPQKQRRPTKQDEPKSQKRELKNKKKQLRETEIASPSKQGLDFPRESAIG